MKAKSKSPRLSHVGSSGQARMVDVSAKPQTVREATATAEVRMSATAVRAVRDKKVKKGDPLQTARLAGIMAAKRTSELIPLCHPLALTSVDVTLTPRRWGYAIAATVRTTGPTGVEMEALTAVSVTALTIYDMLKAVDRSMEIGRIRLLAKSGGRSGTYRARP
jgi:cyclic pyranopterin monophosphate synthase